MKDNACLINTARGGIVDEEALSKALAGKVIRSACFDVFSSEPPKSEDPLLARENFYLTPHTGARTIESEARTCEISTDIVLSKLLNYEGEKMTKLNLVVATHGSFGAELTRSAEMIVGKTVNVYSLSLLPDKSFENFWQKPMNYLKPLVGQRLL